MAIISVQLHCANVITFIVTPGYGSRVISTLNKVIDIYFELNGI